MMQKAAYRILDANFNRAREALRVMEEYCRFALNHSQLTTRSKRLRHQLSQAFTELDSRMLLVCRDTPGDVGTTVCVDNQLHRTDLETCMTAAAKRLSEALRVLGEVAQSDYPELARCVERIRYDAYTLEKDIVVIGGPKAKYDSVRLYVLISTDDPAWALSLSRQCALGGADCLQLRSKDLDDRSRLDLARAFVDVCKSHEVISIINDRIDIAVAAEADGVHLGRHDLDTAAARKLQLAPLIIGRTTHNHRELDQACQEAPTYVALGPAFATSTKPGLSRYTRYR